jgi:hypothetical protein
MVTFLGVVSEKKNNLFDMIDARRWYWLEFRLLYQTLLRHDPQVPQ